MSVEEEDIFIITLLCHTRRWITFRRYSEGTISSQPSLDGVWAPYFSFLQLSFVYFVSQNNSSLILRRICMVFFFATESHRFAKNQFLIQSNLYSAAPYSAITLYWAVDCISVCQLSEYRICLPLITVICTSIKRLPQLSGRSRPLVSPNGLSVLPSTCFERPLTAQNHSNKKKNKNNPSDIFLCILLSQSLQ